MGQTLHLKLRTADFTTVTRQEQLPAPADTTEAMWPAARRLLAKADQTRQAIRLIGVSVTLFEGERQLVLFGSRDDRHRLWPGHQHHRNRSAPRRRQLDYKS